MNTRSVLWTGHVPDMGEERKSAYRVLLGKPQAKRPLKSLYGDVRIILKFTFKK
jgi:hypothetical protein